MRKFNWTFFGFLIFIGAATWLYRSKWWDRFVDATARKPSGVAGRYLYQDPKAHYQSFEYLLEKLDLRPDDEFLDVCCGGGGLLTRALALVDRAAGLDHSPDMVALTAENNASVLADSRLDVREGDAADLPWLDGQFDAVANANALFFLPDPVAVFQDIHRVLKPGGRFALATVAKRGLVSVFFGPWRSSMALYTNEELTYMLRQAGFEQVEAYSPDNITQIGYGVKQ